MKSIWLIGTGNMGMEYAKVLKNINCDFTVIGRGQASSDMFENALKIKPVTGGIECFLKNQPTIATHAIIATDIEQLKEICIAVINYGVKNILIEKPGGKNILELKEINEAASKKGSKVYIAYNRRFYSSVIEAEKYIKNDGGITSFIFEFTEWGHVIEKLENPNKDIWFFANSTHVIDMAFFLGGNPKQLSAYSHGENSWHKPIIFSGSGVSTENALFSYIANWAAPGRWGLEVMTSKHRLIFRPLEKLQIQKLGTIDINFAEIDYTIDIEYKPGLFLQTINFIENKTERFCTLRQQIENTSFYDQIIN